LGDKIEKNEMGGTCSAYGEPERLVQSWENLRERDHWGEPRRRWENNNNMGLQEVGFGGIDCIQLAQDRDRWRAFANAAMNLRVP
jgi:hypothetical protein